MKWKDKLLKKLNSDLNKDTEWRIYIEKLNREYPEIGVHLAIFSEPILTKLLEGKKTLESRMSANKIRPFGRIKKDDIILVKKSGGDIVAVFVAGSVNSYSNLTPLKIKNLCFEYSEKLGVPPEDNFWREKQTAKFATIISVKHLKKITPYSIEKKDRTAWVILQERKENVIF
ncbi:MAG: hypothetical protein HEQ40_12395 [Lacibacter sp.]|jgi:ASC-1-like (ASCH) protein